MGATERNSQIGALYSGYHKIELACPFPQMITAQIAAIHEASYSPSGPGNAVPECKDLDIDNLFQ